PDQIDPAFHQDDRDGRRIGQRHASVLFRDDVSARQGLRHPSGQSGAPGKKILGQAVYGSLHDVPAPVDMVDIFRSADAAPQIVREALAEKDRLGLKTIWMQLGVVSDEAAKLAQDAGLTVVMDRCPKIEHGRFSGEIGWMGVNRKVIDNRKPLLFGKGGSLKRV